MSNPNKMLSDLYADDPEACAALCEAAALYYAAEACRLGKGDSPFLKSIPVSLATRAAKRNGRKIG